MSASTKPEHVLRAGVLAAIESMPAVLDMRIPEYFEPCDVGAEERRIIESHASETVHEFMVTLIGKLTRRMNPQEQMLFQAARRECELLAGIERSPLNHMTVLYHLYFAADGEDD